MMISNETFTSRPALLLTNTKVHIWHASLDQPVEVLQKLGFVLSEEEIGRAERFRYRQHRQYFIAGRGILRFLLSQYTGIAPGQIQFAYTQSGKPLLTSRDETMDICFNLAHAGGLVLYAFTCGRRIGIDLEAIRPIEEMDEVAKMNFSPQEYQKFQMIHEEARLTAFYNCWTRKEAFVKAIGDGRSYPLQDFEVSLAPGETARLISLQGSQRRASNWSMHDLRTRDGHVAALVVEGNGYSISHRQWTPPHFFRDL